MAATDRGKTLVGVLGGLVSGLAIMAGTLAVVRALRTPSPSSSIPAANLRVIVRSSPGGAQLLVDGESCGTGKCELDLKPGAHLAEARRAGYTRESREFIAKAGLEVELTIQPLPSVVEVVSDLMSGELRLDDKPPVPLGGGGAQLTGIEPGEHQLRFQSGAFRADFKFESQPGAPPRLLVPPVARGLRVVVVAGAGPMGRLWATEKNAELSIGARELGVIPEEGIALPAMERGAHQFVLKPAKGQETTFAYEIAENPTAWIWLRTYRRLGTLRISSAAGDDAKVILDGKDSGARIRGGRSMLLAAPGSHKVSLEKAGFLTQPPEQRALVIEGAEAELEFKLEPIQTRATLPITGAPPGAAVSVDDKPVGTVGLDGTLVAGDLDPGTHVVTARRDGFVSGRWEVRVATGRNPALKTAMQRAAASLRVVTEPVGAAASITLRRMGEFEERVVNEPVLQLPEGDYTVTAVDAAGRRASQSVRLEAGKQTVAALSLGVPPSPEVAQPVKQLSLSDWDGAPGWNREGDRLVTEGGGIMLAPTRASGQTVTFTAHVGPGKAVRWVTQFKDINNFTLYELDGGAFSRSDVVGGRRIRRNRAPFGRTSDEPVRIRMDLQAGVLRTSAFAAGQWVDLDTASSPNGTGRFGFYLPPRDKLALSEFRYEYR